MTLHLSLRVLCLLVVGAAAAPAPGRVPKVYNALISSNQNLEPSKAYPVYQPVLHDAAFAYPFQPAVYYGGDFPLGNSLLPASAPAPNGATQPPPLTAESPADVKPPVTENAPPSPPPQPSAQDPGSDATATPGPPPPPNTESPIPLNEFGLPAQVLPLGRIDPAYNGFTQIGPFTYNYPGLRFYDPYDPFNFSPYANLAPFYRPLPNLLGQGNVFSQGNVLSQGVPTVVRKEVPSPSALAPTEQAAAPPSAQAPPPEPSDLNVLNYASKDPAIPNVPPPPLPQGGLKADQSE